MSVWPEYKKIYEAIANLDDARQGIYVRYAHGPSGQPGTYSVEPFPFEPRHVELWQNAVWPSVEDAEGLIERVPFAELAAENFNIRRGWELVRKRKGSAT